jgi:hypothetical protein
MPKEQNKKKILDQIKRDLQGDYWGRIGSNVPQDNQPDPKYKSVAEFFEKIGQDKLAAFFYYVSQRNIPRNIRTKLIQSSTNEVYGIRITRQEIKENTTTIKPRHYKFILTLWLALIILIFLFWKKLGFLSFTAGQLKFLWIISIPYSLIGWGLVSGCALIAILLLFLYSSSREWKKFISNLSVVLIILSFFTGNVSYWALSKLSQRDIPPPPNECIANNAVDVFWQTDKTFDALEQMTAIILTVPEIRSMYNYINSPYITKEKQSSYILRVLFSVIDLQKDLDYSKIQEAKENQGNGRFRLRSNKKKAQEEIKPEVTQLVKAICQYEKRQGIESSDGIIEDNYKQNSTLLLLKNEIQAYLIAMKDFTEVSKTLDAIHKIVNNLKNSKLLSSIPEAEREKSIIKALVKVLLNEENQNQINFLIAELDKRKETVGISNPYNIPEDKSFDERLLLVKAIYRYQEKKYKAEPQIIESPPDGIINVSDTNSKSTMKILQVDIERQFDNK